MKKICVITGSRAEYGLLYPVIRAIDNSPKLTLQLVVTGSHLDAKHGLTVNEIKKDNIKIDFEIDMLLDSVKKSAPAKSMGLLMIQLSQCFEILKPDILLILGDRYEILTAAACAVAMNIPIAHIHGGESTEGAIDEQIRHAITKMAHIHFATTDVYKSNILRMGEQAFRVFQVGAPVMENIKNYRFLPKTQLEAELVLRINAPLFIITYHPVTLMDSGTEEQVQNMLEALSNFEGTFIFTGANADFGGDKINDMIKNHVEKKPNCRFYQSLGRLYLDVCKHADVMVGNSSSGIIEAPCLKLPVVNIGDRQKGRLRHINVIDTNYDANSITDGIKKALTDVPFKSAVKDMENLYGDGRTSEKIVDVLERVEINQQLMFKSLVF